MRVLGFRRHSLAPILAFLFLLPLGVEGQLRTVASNEIAVSENEASLRLGFQNREDLTISLQDGQVQVDGEVVGSYSRRDGLDLAWRSLLGEVITLDDGPLAIALNDWDPPRNLTGEAEKIASHLDRSLEAALALPQGSENNSLQEQISIASEEEGGLLGALLSRTGAMSGLAEALEGVPLDNFILKIGEDVVVEAGEELEGNLIVVDGDLDVRGRVLGDVVVTGGTVRLLEDGIISGNLRIADGALENDGGSISGSYLSVEEGREIRLREAELEALRAELESEIRSDLLSKMERPVRRAPNLFLGVIGNLGNAIAGLLENLVTFLILAILGVIAVHFQGERLEVVATTARRAPLRAGVVGLAGGFFLAPVWIVGIIALAITIIGIPVLLAWVPLFPILASLAILLGFLGVARNVGEWVAEQEYRGLEWIRGSNTFYTVVAGVGALMVPCVAASASEILGFSFLTGLLGFVGRMVAFAAGAVGFGAVLLTRGGKIRPLESYYDFEEDYWADASSREEDEGVTEPVEVPDEAVEEEPDGTPQEDRRESRSEEAEGGDGEGEPSEPEAGGEDHA